MKLEIKLILHSLFEKAWETILSWIKENGYTFDDREYIMVISKHSLSKSLLQIFVSL